MERRLLGALVLTFWNLASSNQFVKNKATVDVTGYVLYPRCYAMLQDKVVGIVVWSYIHIGVRSALLVSTNWAMREPQNVGRVTGTGSHAFLFIYMYR